MITPQAAKRCAKHTLQEQLAAHRAELASLRTDVAIKNLDVLLLERRIARKDFDHEDRRVGAFPTGKSLEFLGRHDEIC